MNKVEFHRSAKSPYAKRYDNFIGGKWVPAKSGKYFENTSPVNGRVLCEIARSDGGVAAHLHFMLRYKKPHPPVRAIPLWHQHEC